MPSARLKPATPASESGILSCFVDIPLHSNPAKMRTLWIGDLNNYDAKASLKVDAARRRPAYHNSGRHKHCNEGRPVVPLRFDRRGARGVPGRDV